MDRFVNSTIFCYSDSPIIINVYIYEELNRLVWKYLNIISLHI